MLPPHATTHRTWTRDGFLISTDPSLIPLQTLNAAFASDDLYWAKSLPTTSEMQDMLDSSLCFGLYSPTDDTSASAVATEDGKTEAEVSSPALIGFARLITDRVTFAYLTDVYLLEAWRGRKLGEWLVGCVQELVGEMPYLRRVMAILGDRQMARFYEKLMGLEVMKSDDKGPVWVVQKRGPGSSFA